MGQVEKTELWVFEQFSFPQICLSYYFLSLMDRQTDLSSWNRNPCLQIFDFGEAERTGLSCYQFEILFCFPVWKAFKTGKRTADRFSNRTGTRYGFLSCLTACLRSCFLSFNPIILSCLKNRPENTCPEKPVYILSSGLKNQSRSLSFVLKNL